jgi:hypothetical protein
MSIPITFLESLTLFADKNTSIPQPEPISTTTSPSLISAKFTGAPHPTPRIDDSGTASKSLASYPKFFAKDGQPRERIVASQSSSQIMSVFIKYLYLILRKGDGPEETEEEENFS